MSLTQVNRNVDKVTISALMGSKSMAVLEQLATAHTGTKTAWAFPEPWVDDHRHGAVTLLKGELCKIPVELVRVTDPAQAVGIFLLDSMGDGRFSTRVRIDKNRGVSLLSINPHISAAQVASIARNIMAVIAGCTWFVQDEQGRFYPDPHKVLCRPAKVARPWVRNGPSPAYMFA